MKVRLTLRQLSEEGETSLPANRSRTQEWRRCLRQVCDRQGALEIAIANSPSQPSHQLVWRVRLLEIRETEFIIEQPSALGQSIPIEPGVELLVMMNIGQNRWMFTAKNLCAMKLTGNDRRSITALRLTMPDSVERCPRRQYERMETGALNLPQVEMWPLLDPKSVLVAERASELHANSNDAAVANELKHATQDSLLMPEVGPRFTATLVNLGGGGVGLRVSPQDSASLGRHKLFWIRVQLPSAAAATSICATGKLVHTHMESNHDTYAGLAFDFSFNPAHQKFVTDQICRYIAAQQQTQQQYNAAA